MKKIVILAIFFTNINSYAFVQKLDQIKDEDKKTIDQLKFEKGGLILFEQLLVKKEKYNNKDPYKLEVICEKPHPKKEANCKVISYEVLKKEIR